MDRSPGFGSDVIGGVLDVVDDRGGEVSSRDPSKGCDRNLQQGTLIYEVDGREGQFAAARGRIAANFLLSDTGDRRADGSQT